MPACFRSTAQPPATSQPAEPASEQQLSGKRAATEHGRPKASERKAVVSSVSAERSVSAPRQASADGDEGPLLRSGKKPALENKFPQT